MSVWQFERDEGASSANGAAAADSQCDQEAPFPSMSAAACTHTASIVRACVGVQIDAYISGRLQGLQSHQTNEEREMENFDPAEHGTTVPYMELSPHPPANILFSGS
ncbi:hypothetical protein Q7P37_003709 [Cladosporium fusiforme]